MDKDQTWIEPKPPGSDPGDGSEYDSLPPMPPAPEPPGSREPGRWKLRELVIGIVLILICLGGGFTLWQSARRGLIPLDMVPTITPNAERLTLTAEEEDASSPVEATEEAPVVIPTEVPADTEAPPTATELPTETPTETLAPTLAAPEFTTSQAMFCRQGPSATYDIGRALNANETYPIVGQSISPVDGTSIWWQIDLGDRLCFVSSTLGSVVGDAEGATFIQPPPTVTPTPTATPSSTPTPTTAP